MSLITTPEVTVKVDTYINKAPEFSRLICEKLRQIILAADPDIKETFKWSAPVYEKQHLICAYGAFKKHVRLSFFQGAFLSDPAKILLEGEGNATMRSINFSHVSEINEAILTAYVQEATRLIPQKNKPAIKELLVPEDLAQALENNVQAKEVFEKLAHTHRKEYIRWIEDAKKAETRERRITQALAKLTEGKKLS